jgi:hypothetical protein
MCEPATIAMVTIAAASAAMSIQSQTQQQQASKELQKRAINENQRVTDANRKGATEAYISQVRQEQLGKQQEAETIALKRDEYHTDAMKAQATARVAAADAGVDGQSLDMLYYDFNHQEAMFMGKLLVNQQFAEQNRTDRETGYGTQFEQRWNSVAPYQPGPIAPVDYISPILGIASSGLNAHIAGKRGESRGTRAAGGGPTYYSGDE